MRKKYRFRVWFWNGEYKSEEWELSENADPYIWAYIRFPASDVKRLEIVEVE